MQHHAAKISDSGLLGLIIRQALRSPRIAEKTKGHLISKANSNLSIWTKKQMKIFVLLL